NSHRLHAARPIWFRPTGIAQHSADHNIVAGRVAVLSGTCRQQGGHSNCRRHPQSDHVESFNPFTRRTGPADREENRSGSEAVDPLPIIEAFSRHRTNLWPSFVAGDKAAAS